MGHIVPEPEIPDGAEHLAEWFWRLSEVRHQGFNGPLPIGFSEIQAWINLTGEIVSREEVAILRAMDAAYLAGIDDWRAWRDGLSKKPASTPQKKR